MSKKKIIEVEGSEVVVIQQNSSDYISLTDMAKCKNAEATGVVISHWLSTRYAIDFLGIWERFHNPNFNVTEFRNIRMEAGTNFIFLHFFHRILTAIFHTIFPTPSSTTPANTHAHTL